MMMTIPVVFLCILFQVSIMTMPVMGLTLDDIYSVHIDAIISHKRNSRYNNNKPETKSEFVARMRDDLHALFNAQLEVPGLWIGFNDPLYGDLFFVMGHASMNNTHTIPASLDHYFAIASISKTFGGTLVLLLVEQGVLSLQDTLGELVPALLRELPHGYEELADYTVEDLLRMETTIPDVWNDPDHGLLAGELAWNHSLRYTQAQLIEWALDRFPAPPNTYSSTNYILIDAIIETVLLRKKNKGQSSSSSSSSPQQSISALLEQLILEPLGLHHTLLVENNDVTFPEPFATPYASQSCNRLLEGIGLAPSQSFKVGSDMTTLAQAFCAITGTSAGMLSTITDLLAWAKSGTGDDLLTRDMQELRHEYNHVVSTVLQYGIAQFQIATDYIRSHTTEDNVVDSTGTTTTTSATSWDFWKGWYGHDGEALGYRANAFRNRQLNASFAGAINTCGYSVILDQTLKLFTQELQSRTTQQQDEQEEDNDDVQPIDMVNGSTSIQTVATTSSGSITLEPSSSSVFDMHTMTPSSITTIDPSSTTTMRPSILPTLSSSSSSSSSLSSLTETPSVTPTMHRPTMATLPPVGITAASPTTSSRATQSPKPQANDNHTVVSTDDGSLELPTTDEEDSAASSAETLHAVTKSWILCLSVLLLSLAAALQ